jgi:G:T-mismatch repair DNA endonuclease (very short patch repair protein)
MGMSRSEQMARIRSRNTTPELVLRRLLWRAGLRYRVQGTTPAGRPDITFLVHEWQFLLTVASGMGAPITTYAREARASFGLKS